jgi:hypothetical protein
MSLLIVSATDHVLWNLQLFQVEIILTAVAMHAVSERTQTVAQISRQLMHLWARLGIGCCLCMMMAAGSEGDDQPFEAFLLQLR